MKKKSIVIKMLKALGFLVEYDQWDIKSRQWIRFRHIKDTEQMQEFALIVYKVQSEDSILHHASEILLKLGQWQKIQQLNQLI